MAKKATTRKGNTRKSAPVETPEKRDICTIAGRIIEDPAPFDFERDGVTHWAWQLQVITPAGERWDVNLYGEECQNFMAGFIANPLTAEWDAVRPFCKGDIIKATGVYSERQGHTRKFRKIGTEFINQVERVVMPPRPDLVKPAEKPKV